MAARVKEVVHEVQLVGDVDLEDLRWFVEQTKTLPSTAGVDFSTSANGTLKLFVRAAEPKDY
jgi:hypothetical protein